MKIHWTIYNNALLALLMAMSALAQTPGTMFTYQGRLENAGVPAMGLHDLRFRLWTSENDPNTPFGPVVCKDSINISDGLFTTQLDFGQNVFVGLPLWLGIEARADTSPGNCNTGSFTPLSPRQPLAPAPYAMFAASAQTAGLRIPFTATSSVGVLLHLTNNSTGTNTSTGFFENFSTGNNSRGLTVNANGSSGLTYGLYAQCNSSAGYGVYGRSEGVAGVSGLASGPTGVNYGVAGESASSGGRGVFGYASASSGSPVGVYGQADSAGGYAGYFVGNRNYFSGSVGIGTASPASLLHISGTQAVTRMVTSSASNGSVIVLQNNTAAPNYFGAINFQGSTGTPGQIAYTGSHSLTFRVDDREQMRLDAGGVVKLGNTASGHLAIDRDGMNARNGGAAATLNLNSSGGDVAMGPNQIKPPLAYGHVLADGSLHGASANVLSVNHTTDTGTYSIEIAGGVVDTDVLLATGHNGFCMARVTTDSPHLSILTRGWNGDFSDEPFHFVVIRP